MAVVIVARHKSTSFAYSDAIWAKYGKQLSEQSEYVDPKTKEAPKINIYGPAGDTAQAGRMDALIKKGAPICGVWDVHARHRHENRQGQWARS